MLFTRACRKRADVESGQKRWWGVNIVRSTLVEGKEKKRVYLGGVYFPSVF